MNGPTTAIDIKDALLRELAALPPQDSCVLLDYPWHLNTGDHLIWLGEVMFLTGVLGVED
jgi:exopolysaccharide biosynthesis predicted pyruvyltransferase EpsI